MTDFRTRDCECKFTTGVGQPRPEKCTCGNRFQTPAELAPPKPRKPLAAVSKKRAAEEEAGTRPKSYGSTLNSGKGFDASPAQRRKVKAQPCVGCGRIVEPDEQSGWTIDPAHVWPKGKGGCDHPDCVLPACRFIPTGEGCHRLFDEGKLRLLERVSERSESFGAELAHPIRHHGVSLLELVRRLAGNSHELVWVPQDEVGANSPRRAAA